MNSLTYEWTDSASALRVEVPKTKPTFHKVLANGLKRTVTSGFWICTLALLTTQFISRVPLPNDGQVVNIPSSSLSDQPKLNNSTVFWLNGVVSSAEEEVVSNLIIKELTPKIADTVTLISNGSLCQDEDGNCSKGVDYIKAFLNRFGNELTGRGNESIIEATKNRLREQLSQGLQDIQLMTYSEGGLIAYAAISDLNREENFDLKKMTVILMGTPLHHDKIAELEVMVGQVVIINNPNDPVTCLQKDVFRWSSLFSQDSNVTQCVMNGDISQHTITLYMEELISSLAVLK